MSKFKVDDKVYIADSSCYKSQGTDRYGEKMEGKIISPSIDDWWYVTWSNGDRNAYRDADLIHASDGKIKVTTTSQNGFEIGETVECRENGRGMSFDQLGKLFVIVEFGDYAGDPGVKLKYKSNGKTYPNPMYDDFVDIRSICKTQSMQSGSKDPEKPETEVYFTIDGVTYAYQLESTYYNHPSGDNNMIFELLGVNKYQFCSEAYGYEAGGGDWPVWKFGDKEAPIKIVKAIREEIAKYKSSNPKTKENALLAEAQRRYPIGTQYKALNSNGDPDVNYSTSKAIRKCDIVFKDHTGIGIDCGYGYVYAYGKWAEVVNEGTATTAVGVSNISTQASTGTGGLSRVFVENPTQYITINGAVYSDNHLPQQQTPIILSRTKNKNKIKVL